MSLHSPRSVLPSLTNDGFQNTFELKQSELPVCVRCKKPIISGQAYELGDDRWHTHCFTCYRCEKSLSCDSDFLVLGTGALICFDCSDSCKRCGKKIDDLAIILSSSNEAYCSSCFVCYKCGENIKDLRYAKTRKGLFCLKCHQKLLAKRKYYQEKKRREMKNLPILPEPLKNNSISTTLPEFHLASPAPYISETSPSKNKSSSVEKLNIENSLNRESNNKYSIPKTNQGDKLSAPKPKTLLNKTPLKNSERQPELTNNDRIESVNSEFDKKHRKELSLPFFDSEQQLNITPVNQVLKANDMSKKHLKSYSDITGSIPTSPLLENDNDTYNENTFTTTPLRFLHLPIETTTTTTTLNDFVEQQPVTPNSSSINNEDIAKHEVGYQSEYSVKDGIHNDNTTMSDNNNILRSYMDRSSLLNEKKSLNLKERINSNNDNSEIREKITILNQLEEDIVKIQATKTELLQTIENMQIIKKNLENKLKILKEEINSAQHTLNEYSQQPQLFSESFSNDNIPIKNESTVSVFRPTTKPKFWKIFSSKTQNPPSITSSPISHSRSNQNISHLRNLPGPQLFNNSNIRSSPDHTTVDQTKQKIDISQPMLQHPEDLKDINLVPIANHDNEILPLVLTKCIQYIESDEENLKSEGLYRKSGSKRVIEEIEAQFNSGEKDIDLSQYDINAVTSVLKKYLRNLPNPIITYEIYEPIIDYVRRNNMNLDDKTTKQGFIQILKPLPKKHIDVLKLLGKHINLVQKYSEFNLMTAKNLYLIFTPSLIRDYSGEKDIIDLKERNFVISYILEHYLEIFD